jgi:hypothetical protein
VAEVREEARGDETGQHGHARDEDPPKEFDGLLFCGQLGE